MHHLKHWPVLLAIIAATALVTAPGCEVNSNRGSQASKKDDGHDHPEKGKHGGIIVEWGGNHEYHLEFTVDHKKKASVVYLWDHDIEKPSPIKAEAITLTITNVKPPLQIALKAQPQEGDPEGTSSRFAGTHEQIGKVMDFRGEIEGMVDGKNFVGNFDESKQGHAHPHPH